MSETQGSKPQRVNLEAAIGTVRAFFAKQCGWASMTYWSVLAASEDLEAGMHMIRCAERCYADPRPARRHEVWVDMANGEIVRTFQLPADGSE